MSAKYLELLVKEEKQVNVVCSDGHNFVGRLISFDQKLNLVLKDCEERKYVQGEPMRTEKRGLFMIRGDNVGLIGEIDNELEMQINYEEVKAGPLKTVFFHT